jgi:hypothetical protein
MLDIRLLKIYLEVYKKDQLMGLNRAHCYQSASTLANAVPELIAELEKKDKRINELERGILYPYEVHNVSNSIVSCKSETPAHD